MKKIGIVTEEAADLPPEIIEKYQIGIIPVKLDWPEIENVPGENTFQKMRELERRGIKSFGKTSQPSPKDFLDKFRSQLEKFDNIICVTLTSKLSGSHNSAIQAKAFLKPEDQGKIWVLDSLSASGGQSLIILKAIDLIESGKNIEEIVSELERFIPQVHLYIMFEDPKWIEASGRISHLMAGLLRRMISLGIRPVTIMKKGVLVPGGMKTNAKDITIALFRHFEKETKKTREKGKGIKVVITHGDDLTGAQRLKEMIEKEFKNTEVVFMNIIDNVIGAPTGPNTLMLAWCEN